MMQSTYDQQVASTPIDNLHKQLTSCMPTAPADTKTDVLEQPAYIVRREVSLNECYKVKNDMCLVGSVLEDGVMVDFYCPPRHCYSKENTLQFSKQIKFL